MNIQVPGEGPRDAKIVLIGEAPGGTEARLRKPFAGPAGDLLTQTLASAGITRQTCYITNVFKEQPYHNDIEYYVKFPKKGEPLYLHDALDHINYFYEELEKTNANVYVALGRIPLYFLTGLFSLLKRRGSVLELHGLSPENYPSLEGRKVIPVIHPAAALRVFEYRFLISKDIHRVKADAESPDLNLPQRVLEVDPGYENALDKLEGIRQAGLAGSLVAFDIEVLNKHVSCISFADRSEYALVIPFIYHFSDYYLPEQEAQLWLKIEEILSDERIRKVAQNCIFDCSFLLTRYGIVPRNVEDTMTAHYVLFPEFKHGLDFLCSTLSREPYYKDEGKESFGTLDIDNTFLRYNAKDSAVLLDIFPLLEVMLKKQGNWETYRRQIGTLSSLLFIQERAVRVDLPALEDAKRKSLEALTRIQGELDTLVGKSLNVNSTPQMKKYFYEELKIKPHLNKGKPTLNDDALGRIYRKEEKGSKEALLCREIRGIRKMRSSYLLSLLNDKNRLTGAYKPMGTVTGRFACGKTIFDTGVPMQTLPDNMRRNCIADPGYVAFEADLRMAENMIVAWTGPEPTMKQAFLDGVDLHCLTAGMIFNIPASEVSREKGSTEIGGGQMSQRDWGKRCNHGLNYNLGYKKFSFMFLIREAIGKVLVEKYHNLYPQVRNGYHIRVKEELGNSRTVTNCYGRVRKFFGRWGEDLFTDAYSQGPQSTVADKMNDLLARLYEDEEGVFAQLELLNQVHDSIWFQLPLSLGPAGIAEVLLEIRKIMEEPIPLPNNPFVIPADFVMGYNFSKKAMIDIDTTEESVGLGLEKLEEDRSKNA